MKKQSLQKVLSIDPGTKHLGVAFFEGKNLIYHGVKIIKHLKSPEETLQEGKKLILRLITDYKPDVLVVEKTFFSNNRNSALLNVFADEIQSVGKRKGLIVKSFAANTVRKQICGNGSASKDEVAKVVVSLYPELKPYLTSDRKWKETFHRNMFDAVALGLLIVNQSA
ncbi:MAG: crossover junction endodeoxyribonuclease RuvC [Candidatus Paceibacterota bacterium]